MKKIKEIAGGEVGWYVFSGNFEWLSIPDYRMTDAASLGFNVQLQWSNNNADFWSTMTYDAISINGIVNPTTTRKEYGDMHLVSEGLYCEWDLPSDTQATGDPLLGSVTSLEIYLRGKARIGEHNVPQGFTIYSRYEHVYSVLSLNPGFSWDGTVIGVSVNPAWHSNSNTYTSHCGVHYDPSKSTERG